MIKTESFKKVQISSVDGLRNWLLNHHQQKESIWLVTFKKQVPDKYISTDQILDELLCFGWIDGIRRKLDTERTMQLISPRNTEHWAKTYKDRAAKLIEEGRMHHAGLKSIATSKQNGLWNFMDDVDQLIVPMDLQKALDKHVGASAFFQAINNSSKRFVLRWIKLAKTDNTRARRIDKVAQLSAQGQKLPGS